MIYMQSAFLLQSVQGGPFSNSSRMIDIDIPAGHLVDMSKSFVQLECSLNLDADYSLGVVNAVVTNVLDSITPMNVDLIRNASLVSSNKGVLEDIRRVNVLSHNLMEFTKSTNEKLSTIDSLYQTYSFGDALLLSPFIEYNKTGNIPSTYRNAFLRVPLSQLFQLGMDTAFDTNKLGSCRIHLELDNLSNFQVERKTLETEEQILAVNPILGGNAIPMSFVYDSIKEIPFFVGEHVTISYTKEVTGSPDDIDSATAIITQIDYSEETGLITITTDYSFVAGTNTSYTDVEVTMYQSETSPIAGTFNILTAQLGLTTLNGVKAPIQSELQYFTFTTEEFSTGGVATLNKMFEIEPECANVFLMQNDPTTKPSSVLSLNDTISKYRLRIDGLDVVDRDININYNSNNAFTNDPLHYELIKRTFLNASFPLHSVLQLNLNQAGIDAAGKFDAADNHLTLICTPTPMTENTKKFQVNLETYGEGGQINNLILFKHILRSVKL